MRQVLHVKVNQILILTIVSCESTASYHQGQYTYTFFFFFFNSFTCNVAKCDLRVKDVSLPFHLSGTSHFPPSTLTNTLNSTDIWKSIQSSHSLMGSEKLTKLHVFLFNKKLLSQTHVFVHLINLVYISLALQDC